ncbi:MAG: enoyl-CoA hydratase-related protein [Syntrophales bacterium]|jgi:crotonobetainyl-CoA hydratase|nr:enoyl-CoA hydratase-related protein [Syntrophales bacterium]MDY0043606.1 enoyl-CoA hydratase-related protein [Syntrophales bacterium]
MNYELIKVEKKDHITILTINRPDVMNSISPPTSREMSHAFNEFDNDPDAWICIITGAGDKAFSAGNDLKYQAEHGGEAVQKAYEDIKGGLAGNTARFDCFKPFIAAVNGLALGGGFEIALACDIIIASENATFGLPEPRVGLMAGAGGVHRLPRQIPYHLAMGMIMTSKRLTAQEAFQCGIVNEVVSRTELMSTAEKWAAEILKGAPLSIRASKEAAVKGLDMPLEKAVTHIFPGMEILRNSEDLIEGPKAFAEKRPPHWKGR